MISAPPMPTTRPPSMRTIVVAMRFTSAASMRRLVQAARRVEQKRAIACDAAAVRRHEPRHHVDDRGLTRTGGPEQRGDAVRNFEFRREAEFAELFLHVDRQHLSLRAAA